jgi:uncharacterized membrane protein YgcG
VRDSLLTWILFGPLFLLPTITGCHMLHPTPTVPVVVVDAETKEPITGAEVQLWTRFDVSPGHVEPSGITGTDGMARIKAAFSKEADVLIHVCAPNYLPDAVDLMLAGKGAGAPPGGAIVEMFAGPRPAIQLLVPDDFRGDLKVEVKIQDDAPIRLRQREFLYKVPPLTPLNVAGVPVVVHVVGPPIFERGLGPEVQGLRANGTPMPKEPKDTEVVLRWVRSEGLDQYFVVGTKIDQESARHAAEKNIGPRESNNDSKGSGGGRRGGGGGGRGGMGAGGASAVGGGPSGN